MGCDFRLQDSEYGVTRSVRASMIAPSARRVDEPKQTDVNCRTVSGGFSSEANQCLSIKEVVEPALGAQRES